MSLQIGNSVRTTWILATYGNLEVYSFLWFRPHLPQACVVHSFTWIPPDTVFGFGLHSGCLENNHDKKLSYSSPGCLWRSYMEWWWLRQWKDGTKVRKRSLSAVSFLTLVSHWWKFTLAGIDPPILQVLLLGISGQLLKEVGPVG